MSGQSKYRSLWEAHYSTTDAIVFVIDSADKIRFSIAKYELEQVIYHPDLKSRTNIPILFFANKMDLDEAVKPWELEEELELSSIGDRSWTIL
jgi:ADP-ribosylation factor-like protein 6